MPPEQYADLDLNPYARGFWTDDEMFGVTGATSIAIIKLLQRQKVLSPGRYKNPAGKLSRAWKAEDLFRIALAIDFSEQTGFSTAATAAILGAMGRDLADRALSTEEGLADINSAFRSEKNENPKLDEQGLPLNWSSRSISFERPARVRIRIVDREFIHVLSSEIDVQATTAADQFAGFYIRPLGRLVDGRTNNPFVQSFENAGLEPQVGSEPDLSVLEIHLECLALSPFENGAFGAQVYASFPLP